MVERALILPPEGGTGPISEEERREIVEKSPLLRLYGTLMDRESAYEILAERTEQQQKEAEYARRGKRQRTPEESSPWGDILDSAAKQASRTIGSTVGRELGRTILRGILGGIFGGRR